MSQTGFRRRWAAIAVLALIPGCGPRSTVPVSTPPPYEESPEEAQMVEALKPVLEPPGTRVIKMFRQWGVADTAADSLARIGEPAAPALIEGLADPSPGVRAQSARAFGADGIQGSFGRAGADHRAGRRRPRCALECRASVGPNRRRGGGSRAGADARDEGSGESRADRGRTGGGAGRRYVSRERSRRGIESRRRRKSGRSSGMLGRVSRPQHGGLRLRLAFHSLADA